MPARQKPHLRLPFWKPLISDTWKFPFPDALPERRSDRSHSLSPSEQDRSAGYSKESLRRHCTVLPYPRPKMFDKTERIHNNPWALIPWSDQFCRTGDFEPAEATSWYPQKNRRQSTSAAKSLYIGRSKPGECCPYLSPRHGYRNTHPGPESAFLFPPAEKENPALLPFLKMPAVGNRIFRKSAERGSPHCSFPWSACTHNRRWKYPSPAGSV